MTPTYTVITYDDAGAVLSSWTTPPGYDAAGPEQLAMNALDLPGSVESRVWEGDPGTADPIHVRRANGERGGEAVPPGKW